MKCIKCGAELLNDAKFCFSCGHKVEDKENEITSNPIKEDAKSAVTDYSAVQDNSDFNPPKKSLGDQVKAKLLKFWRNMDLFSKIVSILIAVIAILMLVAIISGKSFALFMSIIQLAGAVGSLLIHRKIIKLNEKQRFVKPLILSITILLTLVNIGSFSWVNSENQNAPQLDTPSISNDVKSTVLTPCAASDCSGKNFVDVESEFRNAGFVNIKTEVIEDLLFKDSDKLDTIESISINDDIAFSKDQQFDNTVEVVIRYHTYKKSDVTIFVDFVPNLLFSKYDVVIEVDGMVQGTMPHGEDGEFELQLAPGEHIITFINDESSSVTGETIISTKSATNAEFKISCTSDAIDVETIYIEDMGSVGENEVMITTEFLESKSLDYETVKQMLTTIGFNNIILSPRYDVSPDSKEVGKTISVSIDGQSDYERGAVFAKDAEVTISYHASEAEDPEIIKAQEDIAALEAVFPQETARRVAVVAMTNRSATDVFTSDGNSYDTSKFHSYSDLSGFYMSIHSDGEWSVVDENTWHVENLKLKMSEGVYLKASLDITFDGVNYAVIGGDTVIATLDNLDSNDPYKTSSEKVVANDSASYLVVPPALIEENRDDSVIEERQQKEEDHSSWVSSQFSLWDGAHTDLEDLIKDNLNDEKSYEHIETTYIEIYNQETKDRVNGILSDSGYSNRVEIDDLFITTEFSAKNAFGGTIKNTAFGIASYSNNSITLIAIE